MERLDGGFNPVVDWVSNRILKKGISITIEDTENITESILNEILNMAFFL
jgi:hypothetical protein